MKTLYLIVSLAVLTVFLAASLLPHDAAASPNSCRIKAGNNDVYVRVFNRDSNGNPIRRDFDFGEVYRGVIKKGESKKITSSYGRIEYHFQSMSNSRGYGGNITLCDRGNTIRLP
jgi:hypothetical protein